LVEHACLSQNTSRFQQKRLIEVEQEFAEESIYMQYQRCGRRYFEVFCSKQARCSLRTAGACVAKESYFDGSISFLHYSSPLFKLSFARVLIA